jgi:hypothetical protein
MERVERVDVLLNEGGRAYEGYGWVVLLISVLLGIFAALVAAFPPEYILSSPISGTAYPIMGALGMASIGFNIFAVVLTLIPYGRNERWAWYTLWMLPLMWLSQFALAADLAHLILALLTTTGLLLPYRRFFSGRGRVPESELGNQGTFP